MLGTGYFLKSQKLIPSKKKQSVLIAKITSRKTQKIIGVRGGPNFGSESTVELFCGKLFFATPPPVAVGAGNTQIAEGTQRQSHF